MSLKSLSPGILKQRQKLFDSSKVENLITTEDILFSSSSAAADFSFDDYVFLKDYICPQCEVEIEEDYELEQEEEFQSRIEKALKMNNLIK